MQPRADGQPKAEGAGGRHPRIADFSTHLSGPFATRILTDLGADVVKLENPRVGDGNRGLSPFIAGMGNLHLTLSAGARSVAVDRRSPHWSTVVAAMARWADAVVVGARPKDAARLGIDFATISSYNPDVVYCLVSGYGEDGPWRDVAAHGQTMDAMAGLVPIEWEDGYPVTSPGWRSIGTSLAGVFAATGIMYGLFRKATGATGAVHVSIPVWSAGMAWSWRDLACLANLESPWNEYADLGTRYAMYGTADQRALIVAPAERKFWEEFCDAAGLDALRDQGNWEGGTDFGRGPAYDEERRTIADAVRRRTLAEWTEVLSATNVPFAPVLTLVEAMASEHAAAQQVLLDTTYDGQELKVPAMPVRVADGEAAVPVGSIAPPPKIGEHTAEVLGELGLDHLVDELGGP